jgi:serine/threonine protein kinase
MTAERWAQIQQVFDAAAEMDPGRVEPFLDSACEGDLELRREVESLLRARESSSGFLERPAYADAGPSPMAPGSHIHHYEIVSLLGRGGMGQVFLARDTRLGRAIALKLLSQTPDLGSWLLRFEQEARSASALSHPNVCVIYEINQTERGDHYIAMEYVAGVSLRERLAHGWIPSAQALDIALQIASGLGAAHKAGIVHRDIKPENIMLRDDGLVKLLDFGVAKLLSPQLSEAQETAASEALLTQPGMLVGTVKYMAPEQARGGAVDARADLWSLGVVLYEMLSGHAPFAGNTQTDVLVAILATEPAGLSETKNRVSPHLAKIVGRLLAKDPRARYQTAEELTNDLQAMRSEPAPTPLRRLLPRPMAAALIVMATVVVLAAAGLFFYLRRGATPKTASIPLTDLSEYRRVVAVLPFENLSHDAAQEYFSQGITEEISGQLSKLASLQLISRAAVARHRSSLGNLREVAQDLGAGSLVTGSVRQSAGRVRVNVELIDSKTERTLWAEQYDRVLKDIFAVQSDIATRIAGKLGAALSPAEQQNIERRPTENLEAYQLYLQSGALPLSDRKDNLKAIALLQKAVALDPRFALAIARMSYRQQFESFLGQPEYANLAVESALKALAIDPNLPQAHFSLASAYWQKGQVAQARLSFLKALELDPNLVEAMNNYSLLELDAGRIDQAVYWAARSFRLNSNSGNAYYHLTAPLMRLDDDATTERWLQEGERRHPNESRLTFLRGMFDYVYRGKKSESLKRIRAAAAAEPENEDLRTIASDISLMAGAPDIDQTLKRAAELAPDTPGPILAESNQLKYAWLMLRHGNSAKAMPLIDKAEQGALETMQKGDESYSPRLEAAAVSTLRGNHQKALEWLEAAYATGDNDHRALELDPLLEGLRGEARFKDLLKRMVEDVTRMRDRSRQQLPELFAPRQNTERAAGRP